MRFSGAPKNLRLHHFFHLALIPVIALSITSTPVKCVAQPPQQAQERLREEMERQREQQERERQAEREQEERQREAAREREQQQERQQELAREREQQQEQQQQAERQREQQERQQELAREREQQQEQQQQAERQREQGERQQELARQREQEERQQQAERQREQQLGQQKTHEREVEIERWPSRSQAVPFTVPVNRPAQTPIPVKTEIQFQPVPTAPIRVPVIPSHVINQPRPVIIEPQPVFVPRPRPIGPSPAISIVIPNVVGPLSVTNQTNLVLQQILSTEAAEVQAITNGIDQIMLALIQNSSNPELAKAMLSRMGQPDPMQQALDDQMQGFSAISQTNANRSCFAACSNSPDVLRLSAQCNSGSQAACYQAAASLCQCNLSNGGCGSDLHELQACVQQNTQSANSLATAPGTLNPGMSGPSSQSANPAGSQNSGASSSNCSSNWSACPAD